MRLYQISAPETPVIALADLKAHLRVDHDDQNALIESLGQAAVSWLDGGEGWLGRALHQQTWELRMPSFCSSRIRIPLPPLISVDSVSYYDSNNALQLLSAATYYDVVGAGASQPGSVDLKYGVTWPSTYNRAEAVVIQFTAGYTVNASPVEGGVPLAITQALKLLVGHWYQNAEAVAVGVSTQELPMAVEALLAPYRVHYFA